MKKRKNPRNKGPQRSGNSMLAQVQADMGIQSSVSISYRCSEKGYKRLSIREPEVRTRKGKMTYVRPEYHKCIMRITHVIGHDSLSLSAYIDHMLTQHFNRCEEAIKSPYVRSCSSIFQPFKKR